MPLIGSICKSGPTVLMAVMPSAPISMTLFAISPMLSTLGVSLIKRREFLSFVALCIFSTYSEAISILHPIEAPKPFFAWGQEKFNSTLSATQSKALTRVIKSSGLSAERETLSHLSKPLFLNSTSSGRDFSIPGFLNPTELPKSPLFVSHITGSLLPGFGFT